MFMAWIQQGSVNMLVRIASHSLLLTSQRSDWDLVTTFCIKTYFPFCYSVKTNARTFRETHKTNFKTTAPNSKSILYQLKFFLLLFSAMRTRETARDHISRTSKDTAQTELINNMNCSYKQQPGVKGNVLFISFIRYFIHLLETVKTSLSRLWIIISFGKKIYM